VRRRTHRQKASQAADPLVPLDVERLRAILDLFGVTPSQLARKVRDHQQTIDAILRAGGRRQARRSRVKAMAKALGIPEGYLLGEPVVFPMGPLVPPGYEYLYSPRTELAASRLLTHVLQACQRDLRESPARLGERGDVPAELLPHVVVEAVSRLIRIGDWRQKLIRWDKEVQYARGFTEPASEHPWEIKIGEPTDPPSDRGLYPPGVKVVPWESLARPKQDPSHEQAVLGLIAALEHLLEPWFCGQASLNLAGLEGVAHFDPVRAADTAAASVRAQFARPSIPPKKRKKRSR
jgi:hypothetical protein